MNAIKKIYTWFFIILSSLLVSNLYGQNNQSTYLLSRQLNSIENDIIRLKEHQLVLGVSENDINDLYNILNNVEYDFDVSIIGNIIDYISSLDTLNTENDLSDVFRNIERLLVEVTDYEAQQMSEFDRQLSNLIRYDPTNEFDRKEIQRFQKLRDRIRNEINERYKENIEGVLKLYDLIDYESDYDFMAKRNQIKLLFNDDLVQVIKSFNTEEKFSKLKFIYNSNIDLLLEEVKRENESVTTKVEELTNKASVIYDQLETKEERQSKIDQTLVWTLPVYGILILAILMIPRLYRGNKELQAQIFSSGLILELITVYLLTATILILGIAGKIEPEVLGTLIGGISGYVLGRALKSGK